MGTFEGNQRGTEDKNLSFDQVKAKYETRVFNLILRLVGQDHQQDAEDLTVQTFINAWRAWGSFRRDARTSTWLFIIANNLVKNWYKQQGRQREYLSYSLDDPLDGDSGELTRDIPDWSEFPEKLLLDAEFGEKLIEAVNSLPPDYRQVLILTLWEELPYEEIARIIGVSVPGVKSRLHRARNRLRQRLEPYYRIWVTR